MGYFIVIKTGKEVKMLRVLASKKHRKPHKINSDFEFEVKENIYRDIDNLDRTKSF